MRSSDSPSEDLAYLLTRVLRGTSDTTAWRVAIDPQTLVDAAETHGVLPLVADALLAGPRLPPALAHALRHAAQRAVVDDLVQASELRRVLDAMAAHDVRTVLMKGAQLAHSHYVRPDLRPRTDTDMFVAKGEEDRAAAVLGELGYTAVAQSAGDLVTYQTSYALARDQATRHVVDLHWRIANPQRFGTVLSYEEIAGAAVPVPALGPNARGLSPVHALVLACVHPVAHHENLHRLIWQHDIHLIASRFSSADWTEFERCTREREVAGVCAWSLRRAVRDFDTDVPAGVWQALGDADPDSRTAAYLEPGRRHVQSVWWDLRALDTWTERSRLVRQHLFPSADYMRRVYAPSSLAPLPWLYARRVWHGAQKWLARS